MRWRGRRESGNVEDRRGQGGGGMFPFPMGRGVRRGGGMGLLGLLIMAGLMLFFPNLGRLILGGSGGGGLPHIELPRMPQGGGLFPRRVSGSPRGGLENGGARGGASQASDDMKKFLSVVLADTEDVWRNVFRQLGRTYREPRMVIYSGYTRTACGPGMRQMGPFYCPNDQKVYIDTAFFNELKHKFGASGDFAQAYVVAHEIGHHVQKLLGIIDKVQQYKMRVGMKSSRANAAQVRVELQADCFAGVWANRDDRAKHMLEQGDIEEALNAANQIGDDKIQRRAQGYVVPDSFTHGSSAQRVKWFRRGYQSGSIEACDTFSN